MSAYALPTPHPASPPSDELSFGAIGDSGRLPSIAPIHVPPPVPSPEWLEAEGPIHDLYGHYAEPPSPMDVVGEAGRGFISNLATRDGVQLDAHGIGWSTDDWALRFLPIIPHVTD